MKVLAILALSILIIIASFFLFAFSMCAADASLGGHLSAGERMEYAIAALVTLAAIVGLAKLIRRINRSIGL